MKMINFVAAKAANPKDSVLGGALHATSDKIPSSFEDLVNHPLIIAILICIAILFAAIYFKAIKVIVSFVVIIIFLIIAYMVVINF